MSAFADFWRLMRRSPRVAHPSVCAVVTEGWRVAVLVDFVAPAGYAVVRPPEGGAA